VQPSYLPEPPSYHAACADARQHLAAGSAEQARTLLQEIRARIPPVKGALNGQRFEGLADTDSLLSFFLEAFIHGRYVLLPLGSLRELAVAAPRRWADLLWAPARITTWEGLAVSCFLPVLYAESFRHEDDRVKLGRMTDWAPLGAGLCRGVGQHVYRAGEAELGILEIRDVAFSRE
jgi:type VI secretion system protein ImpE